MNRLIMILQLAICLAVGIVHVHSDSSKVTTVFQWKSVDYAWNKPEDRQAAIKSKEYIPSHNLPLGLDRWRDKVFVTVPRWKDGVVSSLNYVKLTDATTPLDQYDQVVVVPDQEAVELEPLPSVEEPLPDVPTSVEEPLPSVGELSSRSSRSRMSELTGSKPKKSKHRKCQSETKDKESPNRNPTKADASSPALIPYPDFETNKLKANRTPDDPPKITSVFRVRVDSCDRLWVMDTGIANVLGGPTVYTKPTILIYDLKTDKLIRKYELWSTDLSEHSFFGNIVVDVTPDTCDKAFAYLPDLGGHGLVIYDFAKDGSWRIKHNFFHFDPLAGNMHVAGVNVQWADGLFSVALTKPNEDGFRTAYFHPLSSTKEFKVSTQVLKNDDISKQNYYDYHLVGDRGKDAQSSASFIHEDTGVFFYTQLQRDSVGCWNTNKPMEPENLVEVASDNETMIFVNDLKVDHEDNLWFLTDKLPIFFTKGLDENEINYRIFKVPVKEAIAGTACA